MFSFLFSSARLKRVRRNASLGIHAKERKMRCVLCNHLNVKIYVVGGGIAVVLAALRGCCMSNNILHTYIVHASVRLLGTHKCIIKCKNEYT